MRARFALLADYANQTADGKLNIMGVFNSITAASVPAVHAQLSLVVGLETEPTDRGQAKEIAIRLLDADGAELLALTTTVQIPADAPLVGNMPQIVSLTGVRLERFGDYSFYVTVNGEPKADVSFTLSERKPALPADGPRE